MEDKVASVLAKTERGLGYFGVIGGLLNIGWFLDHLLTGVPVKNWSVLVYSVLAESMGFKIQKSPFLAGEFTAAVNLNLGVRERLFLLFGGGLGIVMGTVLICSALWGNPIADGSALANLLPMFFGGLFFLGGGVCLLRGFRGH